MSLLVLLLLGCQPHSKKAYRIRLSRPDTLSTPELGGYLLPFEEAGPKQP